MRIEDYCKLRGQTIDVDVWRGYDGTPNAVEVDLMDTRAADGLRIEYDFERDGWVIKQASTFSWEPDDPVCDPDWQEVAFVKAWAREKPDPRHDP